MNKYLCKLTLAAVCMLTSVQVMSQVLFSGDEVKYRIPAIVQCKSGKIIAFTDHRYQGSDVGWGNRLDIVMKTSTNGGKTWSSPEQMVAQGGGAADSFDCAHGDAAVVVDRESGQLLMMCASGGVSYWDSRRPNPLRMGRYYSSDEGKTWHGGEVTKEVYALIPDAEAAFFTSGRICQSSKIKVGTHYRIYSVLCTRVGNRVVYSDDFGRNWKLLGDNAADAAPKGDEAKVEELPDGSVLLSSRIASGRLFNVFTYTNKSAAAGRWADVVFSSAQGNGIAASKNACNGEVVLAKAKKNGKKTLLLLQSVPLGPERSHVAIFYKELKSPADYSTPKAIATGWEGCYQVTEATSAYSTMIQHKKGDILFLMEENGKADHYDITFRKLSLAQITGNKYK